MPWSSSIATFRSASSVAAAEQIWGLRRTEVLGHHVGLLGLDELQRDKGEGVPCDVAIERQDGSLIRVALSACTSIFGRQSRSIAFVRDITKEVVRRETMAVLNLVADKTPGAVVVTDRDPESSTPMPRLPGCSAIRLRKPRDAGIRTAGRDTDRRTWARLRRLGGGENRRRGGSPRLRGNGDEIWLFGERQGVPSWARTGEHVFRPSVPVAERLDAGRQPDLVAVPVVGEELPSPPVSSSTQRRSLASVLRSVSRPASNSIARRPWASSTE